MDNPEIVTATTKAPKTASLLTTTVLTVLTTVVTVYLVAPWFRPATVGAQSGFNAVQFSRSEGALWFFDTKTGDLWIYDEARKLPLWHFRIAKLGAAMEKVSLIGNPPEQRGAAPAAASQPHSRNPADQPAVKR